MDSEDPDKYYPYPTKGVRYDDAPAAADFPNKNKPKHDGDADETYDPMDVDGGAPLPQLGDDRARLHFDQKDTDESAPEPETITEEPDGLNQGTFGVELEFLVVQCPRARMNEDQELMIKDPHPNDRRWLSSTMAFWELDAMQLKQADGTLDAFESISGAYYDSDDDEVEYKRAQYSRNKLTRVLRDKGLVVIKWPEKEINPIDDDFVHLNDFSESDASDDELEDVFPNGPDIRQFSSVYYYDASKSPLRNVSAVLLKWQRDFERFHKDRRLKIARTKLVDIETALDRCTTNGWTNLSAYQIRHLKAVLRDRLRNLRKIAKQKRENERNKQIDPLHVPIPGLKAQYKAWTVTIDLSVDGNGMTGDRYDNTDAPEPLEEYCWFGAEVVSPVFAMGDERARQAIRDACGSLRDELRCHKPMKVSTGLHIHLGHTSGWTLFQAKRFATFWYLAEKTMLSLHREDRDADMKWCAKIEGGSRLWRALYSHHPVIRFDCSQTMQRNYPPGIGKVYLTEFANNVPNLNPVLTEQQKVILYYIWHYNSITELHEGLGQNQYCRPGVKWRIRGKNTSLQGYGDPDVVPEPGTIEVRIMQGTLDADHINNWVVVLEHVTRVVRDLSDDDFSDLLDAFLNDQTRDRLLELIGVPDNIRQYWRDPKRRDMHDRYWEYPDHDLVDWKDPFDVRGHKATHGAFWD